MIADDFAEVEMLVKCGGSYAEERSALDALARIKEAYQRHLDAVSRAHDALTVEHAPGSEVCAPIDENCICHWSPCLHDFAKKAAAHLRAGLGLPPRETGS